jgi:hypothetical protein
MDCHGNRSVPVHKHDAVAGRFRHNRQDVVLSVSICSSTSSGKYTFVNSMVKFHQAGQRSFIAYHKTRLGVLLHVQFLLTSLLIIQWHVIQALGPDMSVRKSVNLLLGPRRRLWKTL